MHDDAALKRLLEKKERLREEMERAVKEERARRKLLRERRALNVLKAMESLGVADELEAALLGALQAECTKDLAPDQRFPALLDWLRQRQALIPSESASTRSEPASITSASRPQ